MFSKNSAVQHIFYINLFIFLSTIIISGLGKYLILLFSCWSWNTIYFDFYQLITYQFLHKDFFHLFMNMFVLITTGSIVEKYLGYNKFFIYYLICGAFGAIIHMIMFKTGPLIGASGSIWGILALYTLLKPNQKVSILFLPFEIRVKYLISFLFGIEIFYCIFVVNSNISHWAHVGGALTGALIYYLEKTKDVKETFNT